MFTKSWYQSKTIWFNLVTVIVTFATLYGYTPDIELSQKITAFLLVLAPVVNVVLRLFTTKAISTPSGETL